jgi:peptide/nickel transport system permease protein
MIVLALVAPLIAKATGHGPNDLFQSQTLDSFGLPKQGPSGSFLFGADQSGRDVFVRIAYGARISLLVGLVATAIAVVVGTVLGVLAGYRGGWIDTMISRGVDILVSLPLIIFGIGIVAACSGQQGCLNGQLHPGLPLVIVIVALFSWPYVARLVRGQTLSLREKEFVEASRSLGMSETGIMFREILPNLVAPLIVYSSLLIPSNILFEAYLAFLGLGLPSTTPSWGRMLSDATDLLDTAWWLWLFPGVFLVLTVLAFNLLGDGLRDALDPRTGR